MIKVSNYVIEMLRWKRLTAETFHHGNASKKRTHKTNLMSSSLIKKIRNYF